MDLSNTHWVILENVGSFFGNFRELEKSEEGQKVVLNRPKRAKKGPRKVRKYQETVKIGPKIAQ